MKELQQVVSKPKYCSKSGFIRFHVLFHLLLKQGATVTLPPPMSDSSKSSPDCAIGHHLINL